MDSSKTLRTKLKDLEREPEVRRLPTHLAVAPTQKEPLRAPVLLENQNQHLPLQLQGRRTLNKERAVIFGILRIASDSAEVNAKWVIIACMYTMAKAAGNLRRKLLQSIAVKMDQDSGFHERARAPYVRCGVQPPSSFMLSSDPVDAEGSREEDAQKVPN